MTASYALAALAIAFSSGFLSLIQAAIGSRVGTDNATHLFMIGQVRKHGGLFTRIPDLLNDAACGAFPIYLHACLSALPPRALAWAPYLLNPMANAVHVGLFAAISLAFARAHDLPDNFALVATALFAFCPQFYHAFSARNFGFSSRGLGLLFLTAFLAAYGAVEIGLGAPIYGWIAMIAAVYLILAFNTFAAQALVIVGLLLVPLRSDADHWVAIAGGLAVFVVLHPRYSLSYLRDTLLFIRAYARELAPVFILARRHSVWRDLVWDIPRRFRGGVVTGFQYLYENPLVVGLALNPLTIAVVLSFLAPAGHRSGVTVYAGAVAAAGLAAMLLTSVRATRFLGEPERYVEATTPWIVLAGGTWVWNVLGPGAEWALAGLCALISFGQLGLSWFLARRVTRGHDMVHAIAKTISDQMRDADVRLVSNNEQYTKLLLPNPWKFSYFIAVGKPYCGMNAAQAFDLFPILRKAACERIVRDYRITVAVLQKAHFATLFDGERVPGLRHMEPILNTPDAVVLRIDWDEDPPPRAIARA